MVLIIADANQTFGWPKKIAGPSEAPRNSDGRNEYVYASESVDPATYSDGEIGSQLTRSVLLD